jgi:hypothetical protein
VEDKSEEKKKVAGIGEVVMVMQQLRVWLGCRQKMAGCRRRKEEKEKKRRRKKRGRGRRKRGRRGGEKEKRGPA